MPRAYQVAGEDDLGAVADEVLDGGDGGADAGVIGDVLVVVERHVEVGAHEDARFPSSSAAPRSPTLFLAMVAMARVPRADDAWRHRDAT
ncbi:hypothetical protein PR202_ga05548 [Eleusine coracana subsp. coracana]|uniref:Uncharacterized protein n=1 Tax=Eleusine coracana subsp. coracana TaxID=191504 RepID=A0AAV5BTY2_ELECO|nr:hypothetical protein PR202_ga05095 [Eleusine coracana subsp. coracana]GJM89362.1 hypothetical protein PR202_ga05548 [Eleusine coracana subsp. coracana]